MRYNKISRIFAFFAIVFIVLICFLSPSFSKDKNFRRGDSETISSTTPAITDSQGSIYNWNRFIQKNNGVRNTGNGIGQKSINLRSPSGAENFVNDYLGSDKSLRLISQDRSGKNKLEFFYYQQTYNGIPIYNSYFDVVMKNGRIVKIDYNLVDTSEVSDDLKVGRQDSINFALENLNDDGSKDAETSRERIKSGSSVSSDETIFEGRLVWRVIIPNFVYFIDASTGEILSKESTVRDSVYGTIRGSYYPQDPTQTHQNTTFENDYIFLSNGTNTINTTSNGTGFFNLSITGENNLYSYLWGPYVNVDNLVQNYTKRNISIISGDNSWNWSDNDTSDRQEESNVFYHINFIHDYFQKGGVFNITQIDYSIPAYVELYQCNAYYSGTGGIGELDFGNGGGVSGCENLALGSDIIYHEYTHMVTDGIYGSTDFPYAMQTGAMNEGWSDYYACSINNDPAEGDKILPPGSVRYLNNSLKYPDDWHWEVHDDSRMISAAMWQVRASLGKDTADSLILDSMKMKPQSFTDVLNDMLVADDDNGNLDDGTPNSASICSAFEVHGIVSDYCYEYEGIGYSEYSNNTIINIPDDGSYVNSEIIIPDNESRIIRDIEVYVNISHGNVPDLKISLVSPNGTSVRLYGGSDCGWSSGTSLTKWFDQEYPTDGHDCYSPSEMDLFNGMRINGTWYLNVTDYVNTGNHVGQINGFELKFYYSNQINVSLGRNPINYYNSTSSNLTFDFRCSSGNNVSVIQLWSNMSGIWQANYTNLSYANNTWLNMTVQGIPDGSYVWGVYCRDSGGNSDRTLNRTFTIDALSPPAIVLGSPSGYSNLTSIGFNCSATDQSGLKNISLWINSTGSWTENETKNISGNYNSSIFNKNLTPDQTYVWSCRVCDLQSNCNFSDNKTLIVDDSAPQLSLVEPEGGKAFSAGTESINFRWDVTDSYDSSIDCSIYTKDIYQTTQSCTNGTTCEQEVFGFSAGSYSWQVNCSDGANQNISESRDFSIAQNDRGGGGGGGGGASVVPSPVNITNQTNQTNQGEQGTSSSSQVIKSLGNIETPTGISGMPISGLGVGDEIDFKILDKEYILRVKDMSDNSVILEISEINSVSTIANLGTGESREFDLNNDGINDIKVTLNRIFDGKATVILFSLPSEKSGAVSSKKQSNSWLYWIIYLIIAIVLVAVFLWLTFVKRKHKNVKNHGKNRKR